MFEDKAYLNIVMPALKTPKTMVRRICGNYYDEKYNLIDFFDALELIKGYESAVFKISKGTGHGRGVRVFNNSSYTDALKSYGNDFVVQEILVQHPKLAYFNESSVNVVRITSICLDGEVYILGAILRIGAPGAFCDHQAIGNVGYRNIGLDREGYFHKRALDIDNGDIFNDIFGKPIPKEPCPHYKEMVKAIVTNHKRFPDYGIIGWDFTVDKDDEVVCIEMNTRNPGVIASQYVLGPIFGQFTKEGQSIKNRIMKIGINIKNRVYI